MKVLIFGMPMCTNCIDLVKKVRQVSPIKPRLIDVNIHTEKALSYNIDAIPTTVIIREGKEAARLLGNVPYPELQDWFKGDIND